jgi:plasmid stability protein
MLKNITFSVEEEVIAKARAAAKAQGKTLNDMFREWIKKTAEAEERRKHILTAFESVKDLDLGGPKMTREEMNERR